MESLTVKALETLAALLNITKVALGLGFVIFIHELGHFLLAKWNGVKVEKFSIGFGRTIWGFTRGETEYVLAAIPLGGFVKMLGEGPEDDANKSTDPRSYANKSVGARMAIISAGVIMNVFLGLACFVYAYGQGMDETPAEIGRVVPGATAYEAGFRPGDELVSIDGRTDINFNTMTLKIFLSGEGQKLRFDIRRPGQSDLIHLTIEPKRASADEVPRIGVSPAQSLNLFDDPEAPAFELPAGRAIDRNVAPPKLKEDDRLVAMGPVGSTPEKVGSGLDFRRLAMTYRAVPLEYVFERRAKGEDGKSAPAEEIRFVLPPTQVLDLGFRPTMEPISSIRADSPAQRAGFRVGDRIVAVDGDEAFDPMRLPERCFDHAGKPMTFEVERPAAGGPHKRISIEVTPEAEPAWLDAYIVAPLDVPPLGLAYPLSPKIASIVPGSAAEKAGLHVGDVISTLTMSKPFSKKKGDVLETKFGDKGVEWPSVFSMLQETRKNDVDLLIKGRSRPVRLTLEPVSDWYNPARGLQFQSVHRRLPPQSVESALRRGFDDTIENILRIYAMLRSLAQRRVSPTLLGGPIMIARVAYKEAGAGLTELIHFLGILSINLAVLNFLPIPPLDGGQMVFLAGEKIRGRPLPESAVGLSYWIGIILLVALMIFVFFQDIWRLYWS